MNKPILIRTGGWALILAGVTFFLYLFVRFVLQDGELLLAAWYWVANFLVPLLILVGLLGLWARYGRQVGWFGRTILLAGALLAPLAIFLFYTPLILLDGIALGAFYYGAIPAMTLGQICLAIFGIAALKHKPLPRMNWLPLAAGLWFPVAYPLQFFVPQEIMIINQNVFYAPHVVTILIYILGSGQAAAMVLLGLVLQGDEPQQKNITIY